MRNWFMLALLVSVSATTAADFSVLQPQQSSLAFISTQMGVPVEGEFKKFNARLVIDPNKPETGSAQIDIDLASIDVGNAEAHAEVVGLFLVRHRKISACQLRFQQGDAHRSSAL